MMRKVKYLLSVLLLFSFANAGLEVALCEKRYDDYEPFIIKECSVYYNDKITGKVKFIEHLVPPYYGMVSGYFDVGVLHCEVKKSYFAIYRPAGKNALKVETPCKTYITLNNTLNDVLDAVVSCCYLNLMKKAVE